MESLISGWGFGFSLVSSDSFSVPRIVGGCLESVLFHNHFVFCSQHQPEIGVGGFRFGARPWRVFLLFEMQKMIVHALQQ